MKLLLINSEYPPVGGGAGNATANLARQFTLLGHEVVVLTTRFASFPQEEWVTCGNSGFRILRAPALRRQAARSGALEQAIFILGAGWNACRLLKKWRPQAILAFFGVPAGVVALFLQVLFSRKGAPLPYVVSLRGGDVPGFRPYDFALYHRIIAPLLRLVWHRAAGVVANSQGLRSLALAFAPEVAVQIIPNGVDAERFTPSGEVRIDRSNTPELLFVGRVVYQKGLDLLLEALGELKSLPWRLTIVGDGPMRPALQAQAQQLGLLQRLFFPGWLGKDALLAHYQRADLFVFPSRHEGMPNAVLEAMACGLPVIASRIAGNEELVVEMGKAEPATGLLVPAENVPALRLALKRLLLDEDMRVAMGKAGRRRVEQYYTWENVAQAYLAALGEE